MSTTLNLSTRYLGLTLRSPLVASAGPVTGSLAGITTLAEAGVGAVVLPSLFEEQLHAAEGPGAAQTYFRDADGLGGRDWPRRYMNLISRAAETGIPVIASLNGVAAGNWTDDAAAMEAAGASAIELNVYYLPCDALIPARDAERCYTEILTTVKAVVSVPVAVKLAPFFSSLGEMAVVLDHAGADGLVLFNRFLQTDIDPETFTVSTGFRLSVPAEAALPRAWISRLHGLVGCSLAASTGVDSATDVAAYLLAGADVVMTTSALLRHGPAHARVLLDGLEAWMERKGFSSLDAVRGLLAKPPEGEPAYGRAGYLSAIEQATHAFYRYP
jgi:dihydroorotate dehydrogenase (fumarate)